MTYTRPYERNTEDMQKREYKEYLVKKFNIYRKETLEHLKTTLINCEMELFILKDYLEFTDENITVEINLSKKSIMISDEYDDILVSRLGAWDTMETDHKTLAKMQWQTVELIDTLAQLFEDFIDLENTYDSQLNSMI